MVEVVPDSTAEEQNAVRNDEPLRIGIFHADADVTIASRIRQSMLRARYEVDLCEFHDAGNPTVQIIDEFILSHHLVLWLATNTSIGDNYILKQAHYIAQHAATCTAGMPLRFALLKPQEGFARALPPSLAAYTPLTEDSNFCNSLNITMKSIREKMASAAARGPPSSATQNAVTDNKDEMPRQLPPGSDVGTEVLQVDGPGELPLSARPDTQGNTLQESGSSPLNGARRVVVENRNVVINVQGNINNLQLGDVLSTPSAADEGDDNRTDTPEEGTPV